MNIITSLLDIEDNALELLSCEVQGLKKIVTVGNVPIPHFCPNCFYKMQIYYCIHLRVALFIGTRK